MGFTDAEVTEFHDKGLVVAKGFYDGGVVEKVSDWLDALRDKVPAAGEEAKYFEESLLTGDSILVRIENVLGDHNRDVTDLLLSPGTIECLTQLLGEPPVLFKEKVNYKPPGCRPDKLHQDFAAGWRSYGDWYISMGIVIDRNRKENGAITFLKSGNYERKLMTPEWQPLTEVDPPFEPADEYLLLEADPGDVVFFDCFVPHGSPANRSDRFRRNLFLTFNRQSAGDRRADYYRDKWKTYPPNDPGNVRSPDTYRV